MNSETKKRALQYVFECYAIYYPDTDERRLKEAKAFDKKLKLAQLMNDKTTAKELLDSLNDAKYHVVAEKRRSTKELTEEEWEEIFHYRFKYAIPYRRLNISHQTVAKHLPQKYKQENEILNHYLKEPEIYRLSYSKNLMRKRIVMHQ